MCHKLGVARASFYRWLLPEDPTPTQQHHLMLTEQVKRVYNREKGRAGRDQIALLLRNDGVRIAVGTVGSIIRELALCAVRMKAWKKTIDQDRDARTAHIRNHMLDVHGVRGFSSNTPGTRLVGDITYLRTGSGWLYLATVIELCTGEVIAMARDHGRLAKSGGDLPLRPRQPIHLDPVPGLGRLERPHPVDAHRWRVPGQRRGRVILLPSEDRDVSPAELLEPPLSPHCGDAIHRGLGQSEGSKMAASEERVSPLQGRSGPCPCAAGAALSSSFLVCD
jgi:hypothetical protein